MINKCYKTYWKFSIEEVFKLINVTNENSREKIKFWEFLVAPNTIRMQNLKQNWLKCQCCWKEWTHFKLQLSYSQIPKNPNAVINPHFNLYSDDDILMTKKLIVSKSNGWLEKLENMMVYCENCNKN